MVNVFFENYGLWEKKSRQNFCRFYHETIITACNACVCSAQYANFSKKKIQNSDGVGSAVLKEITPAKSSGINYITDCLMLRYDLFETLKRSCHYYKNIRQFIHKKNLCTIFPFLSHYILHVQMYEIICLEINRQFVIDVVCNFLFFLVNVCNQLVSE